VSLSIQSHLAQVFPHHGGSDEGGIHGVFHRICGVEPSRGELGGFVSRMKAGHDIDSAGNVPFSDRTSPPFFRLLPGLILGEECEGNQKKKKQYLHRPVRNGQHPTLCAYLQFVFDSPCLPSVTPWPASRYDDTDAPHTALRNSPSDP
jgi:hypothetical protein